VDSAQAGGDGVLSHFPVLPLGHHMNFSSPRVQPTPCTFDSLIQETTVCPPSRGLFFGFFPCRSEHARDEPGSDAGYLTSSVIVDVHREHARSYSFPGSSEELFCLEKSPTSGRITEKNPTGLSGCRSEGGTLAFGDH